MDWIQDLVPVEMAGFNVVTTWFGFAKEGGCERGMAAWISVADQRAVRAVATLCWRMAGACLALARAKMLMKATASSSLNLPRPRLQALPNGSAGCEEFWVRNYFFHHSEALLFTASELDRDMLNVFDFSRRTLFFSRRTLWMAN